MEGIRGGKKKKRERVRLTLLQVDPCGRIGPRIRGILDRVDKAARKEGGIVVLPEIWSGGFSYREVLRLSRETPGILDRLKAISAQTRSVIIGSLPEETDGRLYNAAAVVDSGRIQGRYYKQRLFAPMGEDRYFESRPTRRRFVTSLGVIGVLICFDLRFPELCGGLRESEAWLLVVPAQWPAARCSHWEALLAARAIENQIFVAGCNRTGTTAGTRFCGRSQVVDPWGRVVARGGSRVQAVTARLDPERVVEVRRMLPMSASPPRGRGG